MAILCTFGPDLLELFENIYIYLWPKCDGGPGFFDSQCRRIRYFTQFTSFQWQTQSEWQEQTSLDATPSKCMPPPFQHSHISTHMTLTFDLWPWKLRQQCPLTSRIFCVKFHWNSSTDCRDISREIGVGERTADGQRTEKRYANSA